MMISHLYRVIFLFFVLIKSAIFAQLFDEYLGRTGKHLFHFVQVTDIHVTHLGNFDRMKQFEEFCNEIIKDLVKPSVTVVSGDLVNNVGGFQDRTSRLGGTGQYEEEWKIYRGILDRTNISKYTNWLDVRGNHDAFMDPHPDSPKSLYRIYSYQGMNHNGSYAYTLKTKDGDTYSFIAVDLCPRPGLGAPFNFYGRLNEKEKQNLIKLSDQTKNSTSTIYFGHYPLSFTYSNGLDQIIKDGLVYLNGHLHSGIKHLYARHSTGLLEIELGDWKRKRCFRIVTIDGGLLSFEDFIYPQPIYAVLSNPKPAKFHTRREPVWRLVRSTHIRIVIFSRVTIVTVRVSIDGEYLGLAIPSIDNQNLFVLPWNTSLYDDQKVHRIVIEIKDQENHTVTLKHEFSLSLSTLSKRNQSKFVLTIHQPTFSLIILICSLFGYIFMLSYYRYEAKQRRIHTNGCCLFFNRFRLRMVLLCSVDLMFYPLIIFAVGYFFVPWYVGYLTDGYFGATALWGTLIQGRYLSPDSQAFIGNLQLYLIVFPMTFCLSSSCFYRYNQMTHLIESSLNRCFRIYSVYILFIYSFALTLFWSFVTTASYRFAWILSPFGVFLPICSMLLFIQSHRLKLEDFKLYSSRKSNENNLELLHSVEPEQSHLNLIKSQ